jgi:Single-strand binding protein family
MQKVLLIGYLGRDPEVRYSAQGTAIAQFSVASTETWKDRSGVPQEHTEWFAVKAFGAGAPKSLVNTCTKAVACMSKAASGPSPGTINKLAANTTETSFTPTELSSSTQEETATGLVTETHNTRLMCRKNRRCRITRSRSEGGLISHAQQ